MAEAETERTEFWDVDKVTRHVAEITGKPLRAAMREAIERVCDEELPHYVNGRIPPGDVKIPGSGGAALWRSGELRLELVKGRVDVVSNGAVELEGCDFGFAADDVLRLWSHRERKKREPKEYNWALEILKKLGGQIQPGMKLPKVRIPFDPLFKEKYGEESPGGASDSTLRRAYKDCFPKG
jgi:hypothetical protein